MTKTVFVTVGSTKFDELIKAVDDLEVADILLLAGYSKMVIQKGKGSYNLVHLNRPECDLDVHCFDYVPSIAKYIEEADLIICHAGAGSIFEGLSSKKLMVAVPNEHLMENHQMQLATKLESQGNLIAALPRDLKTKLRDLDRFKLMDYTPGSPTPIVNRIDCFLGRKSIK